MPIPRHSSTYCDIVSTSGATCTHTSAACGVDITYAYPYRLVEPVQLIEVSSSEEDPEEDPEEDLEEIPPKPAVVAPDIPKIDEDPLLDIDSPEDVFQHWRQSLRRRAVPEG